MHSFIRRAVTTAGATVGVMALFTGSALAHFCYRTDVPAGSQAGKGQAWSTQAEYVQMVQFWGLPNDCVAALQNFALGLPAGTLFLGPGLLAGGTLKNGKGNTPDGVNYTPFPTLCPGLD